MTAMDQQPAWLSDTVQRAVTEVRGNSLESEPVVLTDYVIIAAARGWDGDGEPFTSVVLIKEGPAYACHGLVEEAAARFDADALPRRRR